MTKNKKEEVEILLIHKIPKAKYLLAQYVPNFQTHKTMFPDANFELSRDEESEPVFRILDVLDGPEIPDGLTGNGEYFVIKTVRKFKVTSYLPKTIYSTTELKP